MNEFVDLLPAQQRVDEESWYRGTADAVYQNQDILAAYGADYVVVLAGDHIYKMNYAVMLADHVALGRECTVGCIEVAARGGHGLRRDGHRRAAQHHRLRRKAGRSARHARQARPRRWPAWASTSSMRAYLYRELERDMADPDSSHDFGKDIIPRAGASRARRWRTRSS